MAIMEITNVPELEEFSGTEKIYVNDNGKTKQIACDKVVTAGGGGRIIIESGDCPDAEEIISMIENGDDIWVKGNGFLSRVIGYDWTASCGGKYFVLMYAACNGSVYVNLQRLLVGMISGDTLDRVNNIIK